MNNPFYNAFHQGRNNLYDTINNLRQNPAQALRNAGYNFPESINDPRQIIQHLMQSGQVTQAQVNSAQAAARRMGIRF